MIYDLKSLLLQNAQHNIFEENIIIFFKFKHFKLQLLIDLLKEKMLLNKFESYMHSRYLYIFSCTNKTQYIYIIMYGQRNNNI